MTQTKPNVPSVYNLSELTQKCLMSKIRQPQGSSFLDIQRPKRSLLLSRLTMELMLSGDPEEWLLELSPGNDLLFGDTLGTTATAELRFLRPRLRPS